MSWPIVKLGDVCEVRRGITYSKADEVEEGGIAVLRATNICLETNRLTFADIRRVRSSVPVPPEKIVQAGMILICLANGSKKHLGKVALIHKSEGMTFGGFMGCCVPSQALLPKYLFYVLSSPSIRKTIDMLVDGANINNLRVEDVRALPLPLPSLPEQKRIVEELEWKLSRLEKVERLAREGLTVCEQARRAVLAEAFRQAYEVKERP